jgi:GWxTD domain-containing protein
MHGFRAAVILVAGLCLAFPAAGRGQKLDEDDKRFLDDVRPIILPDERAAFQNLEDQADRRVFQEIFWARRDPDLTTPENEFREQYVRDRRTADRKYRLPGVASGAETDCGRLFILFGEPDAIEPRPDPLPLYWRDDKPGVPLSPLSLPNYGPVWIYRDQPGRRLDVAQLEMPFSGACSSAHPHRFAVLLGRMAALKVVHPNIDYEVGQDGHLVKPADQLAGATPSRGNSRRR